jgi:hypothetical protein
MKRKVSRKTMDAMIALKLHYRGIIYLEDCPLCTEHRFNLPACGGCPWILFGYPDDEPPCSMWSKTFSSFKRAIIGDIREFPENYPEAAKMRVRMLVQWIRNCEVVE